MTPSCMGGFCHLRNRCKHHREPDRSEPVERFCGPKTSEHFEPAYRFIPVKEAA